MSFIKLVQRTLGYVLKHKFLWFLGVLHYVLEQLPLNLRTGGSARDISSYFWCGVGVFGFVVTPWITASSIKGFQIARARRKTGLLHLFSETRIYYLRLWGLLLILGIALIISLYFLRELFDEILKTYPSAQAVSPLFATITYLIGHILYSLVLLSQVGIVTNDLGIGSGVRSAWRFFSKRFSYVIAISVVIGSLSFLFEFVFSIGELSGAAAFVRSLSYIAVFSLVSLLNTGLFTVSYLQLTDRRIRKTNATTIKKKRIR